MNIVYYSSIYFTDCDFPLIRSLQNKGNNVLYIIELLSGKTKGALFNIKSSLPLHGIVKAEELDEFKIYSEYLNLESVYIVVRTEKLFSIKNWVTYIQLCSKIRSFKPAVFHSALILGISESLLYFFRNRMVLTVHDPFVHSGETSKILEIKRKFAFKFTPKLVLLNKNQQQLFLDTYKLSSRKVYLNALGVYDCLNYLAKKKYCKDKIADNYILFFGHFSPYKGIDILCESMIEVHKYVPNLVCVIAGNGNLNFDYSPYAELRYIKLINQYIETERLSNLISNSRFVVCPYKDATQSGVVFSSFALCKPVIATNVGGMNESVIDGKTGILISPNNTSSLTEAIIKLYNNTELISKMENNIFSKYSQGEESWDIIANRYIHYYSE